MYKDEFLKFIEHIKETEEQNVVNICLHNVPDPDAIGSGLGIQYVLSTFGIKAKIYYGGGISHPQNKTLVNVLKVLMEKTAVKISGANICVDCTPTNSCADEAMLVIDHHKNPFDALFSITHVDRGACATIVWELMKELGIEPEGIAVPTGLLLGIRTDTNDLISENISDADFIAYQELLPYADKESIQKIMNYPFPRYLYDKRMLLHKDGNHYEANGIFIGGIGFIPNDQRDVIAILAEEYTRMESVNTAVVFAITDYKMLQVSVRSTNVSLDVGQMCRDLFGENAGGTSYKGGAGIPLNFYEGLENGERDMFWQISCKHMFRKVLKESWVDKEKEDKA